VGVYTYGMAGVRKGDLVQVTNYKLYKVCMTRPCCGGSSAQCAVKGRRGDCGGGVENIFFLLAWRKQVGRASWAVDLGLLCRSVNVIVYVREKTS